MQSAFIQHKKFKIVFAAAYLIWWAIWSGMHIIVLIDFGFASSIAVTDSLVSNTLLAGTCFLILNNMRYYLPKKEKYWYVLAISTSLSAVWLLAIRIVLWAFYKNNEAYMHSLTQSSNIRYGIAFLMTGFVTMLSLLWFTQQDQKEIDDRKK